MLMVLALPTASCPKKPPSTAPSMADGATTAPREGRADGATKAPGEDPAQRALTNPPRTNDHGAGAARGEDAGSQERAPDAAPPQEVSASPDVAAEPPLSSRVQGVQPMRMPLKAFSPEDQEKAIQEVRRAARLVRRGAFDAAIDRYQTALALDANSWSRYELMTTYLRSGSVRPALGMLKELREWADSKFECVICKVWLRKSTTDKLFASVHQDPRYRKLVEDLTLDEPNYETMAQRFLLEVENNDKTMLKASLERQMTVRISDSTRTIDAKTGKRSEWEDDVTHLALFEEVEKASMTAYDEPKSIRCRSRCCRLRYPKKMATGDDGKQTEACDFNQLTRICFWPFGNDDVAVIRVEQRLCEVKPMGMDELIDRVGKPGWEVPDAQKGGADIDPKGERPPGKPTVVNPPENL